MIAMKALLPSVPELRYLMARMLLRPPTSLAFVFAWSLWRRRHQLSAMNAHYKSRLKTQL